MTEIGIRELKQRTSEVLRQVREGKETIAITYRGKVVARLTPVNGGNQEPDAPSVWAQMDELAAEIGAKWPAGVSATEAVREQRRKL